MKNTRIKGVVVIFFTALVLFFGHAAYSQTTNTAFPAGFIETWKRDNFNNTLTFTAKTVKASSSTTTWNLVSINGNVYKMNNGKTDMTLTMRLDGGNLVISGDSGQGENNWNGTWKLRPSTMVEGANLTAKLVWVLRNAQSNGDYTIELTGDETLSGQTLVFDGKTNVTLRFTGSESERTITLNGNGSLFTVESGVNLILGRGITLRGHDKNNVALVIVNQGAGLIMNEGSKITGNKNSGVYVNERATFMMNGGEISGNTASYGGGVYINRGGAIFTMNGGEIYGNTAGEGGGVYIRRGEVPKREGIFIMNGGTISGNTARNGGGVYVYGGYTPDGTFTMNGGEISGNTAFYDGGGVYVYGTFTMNKGEISGNTASRNGGGVYGNGRFTKKSGTIYGYTEGDNKSNVVKDGSGIVRENKGHAVFVDEARRRESTAGPSDSLDPSKTGLAGGWGY